MIRIKICGITNTEDALAAAEYGADALGFVFYEKSPRCVTPERAREIIGHLPPFVTTVGVFVNETPERIREIMAVSGVQIPQLHGDEPPEACRQLLRPVKAIRVSDVTDLRQLERYRVSAFLLDTYSAAEFGGTGQVFNWEIAAEAKRFGRIILAGGLTPENIEQAVRQVRPYGVDVSSGVEAERGKKDLKRLREFIERARASLSPRG